MHSGSKPSGSIPREQQRLRAQPAVGPEPPSTRTLLLLTLVLLALLLAIYGRSLNFQFILDDHRYLADRRIQESGHVWEYFANYVWAQFEGGAPSFYRPVFILWARINFVLASSSPWGWHLLSILKHALVAALLGMLAWKLLRNWQAGFVAAMFFALHPAHTESVSWVTVPDPLMAAGILGALICYLSYVDFPSPEVQAQGKISRKKSARNFPEHSPVWMLASAAAYFAALLSKETAIVFPAVIFGFVLFAEPTQTRKNDATDRASLRDRLLPAFWHTVPFLCVTVLYLLLRLNALGGKLVSATQHLSWRTVILSWPSMLWFYTKAMLWPQRSYAFADPALAEGFSVRGVLLPFVELACCVAVLVTALVWTWRRAGQLEEQRCARVKAGVVLGTLLLVLPLLPALNLNALNPGDFLHGRYAYLSLSGFMLLIATVWSLLEKPRIALLSAAGVLALAFAALTFSQQSLWRDDATVFAMAHQLAPHNEPVARNLANTSVQSALRLDEEGRCSEAIPVFERVLRDYPEDWYAWAGLGDCFVQLKNLPKAEESLHRAAEISHNSRVVEQWQELRAQMGLSNTAP